MGLILEVVTGRDEVSQRVRLDTFPFTIGRGYANDLILDDPYVDARHAQVVRDEDGDVYIEDAGSLNGLTLDNQTRAARIRLASGETVRIGHTMLRVRDTSDEVAPALSLARGRADSISTATLGKRGLAGVIAAGAIAFALMTWLSTFERQGVGDHLTMVLGYLVLAFMWGGSWAIASRIARQRFYLLEHMAILSAVVIAMALVGALTSLIVFFFPQYWVSETVGTVGVLLMLGLLLTAHFGYTSHWPLRRRATIATSISLVLVAIGMTISVATTDEYSDVPSYVSALSPVSAGLIPADEPAALERVAAELKPDVDALKIKD